MYLAKTPSIVKPLYRDLVWNIPTEDQVVYLTFDDGPIPEITPQVLDILASYNAKATFFCIGDNVRKHPDIYRRLSQEGHGLGHHTFNHINGWKTGDYAYVKNALQGAAMVDSNLFRPPYGRIKRAQAASLHQRYHIIMWDVLSGDFDPETSKEQCLKNVVNNVKPGSIVVFHDSLKAAHNMLYALPHTLEQLSAQGYRFEALTTVLD